VIYARSNKPATFAISETARIEVVWQTGGGWRVCLCLRAPGGERWFFDRRMDPVDFPMDEREEAHVFARNAAEQRRRDKESDDAAQR
jgi:hypothetical protein